MSPKEQENEIDLRLPAGGDLRDAQNVPLMARLSHEIPKPKDWQALQRNCVILYRAELNDPNAQEYGRGGQAQHGIDLLGRRGGKDDHWVGIQCRKIEEPLTEAKILSDCRATLELRADLKEIIFATTAPNDTGATDAAIEVEKTLRSEGRSLTVSVLGWDNLSTLIALHPAAYAAFFPAAMATRNPQSESLGETGTALLEELRALRAQLPEARASLGVPAEGSAADEGEREDKALHARIDTYRDLLKNDKQPALAEAGLKALVGSFDPKAEPRADFRIKFNLGSIALEFGREAEAIDYYEQAYAVRPDDPTAIANMALARTLGGKFDEAMEFAQAALKGSPPAKHAVGYLLQAAARSAWQGDPEELVPEELVGSPDADLGLAEFWRIRETPNWPERVIELSRQHPETPIFKRIGALAVLVLASQGNAYLPGGTTLVSPEQLSEAADELKSAAEYYLKIGFIGKDAAAFVSNAAVILRYCSRNSEAEDLLTRAVGSGVSDEGVLRMLGLVQSLQGKKDDALKTLQRLANDGEASLLAAELLAERSPAEGLKHVIAIPDDILTTPQKTVRWQIAAEIAARLNDGAAFENALTSLKAAGGLDSTIELLRIRDLQGRGAPEEQLAERARAVAATVPADIDMPTRVLIAAELRNFERPLEASRLLEGHVDLRRRSAATLLYLQSLAGARRDDAFRDALKKAASEVRESPDVLWLTAAHAWNVGDLAASLSAVSAFLTQVPENFRARLLKIEILARQNKSTELQAELSNPVETLPDAPLEAQLRIVTLLGHFGFTERAAAFAYRLFLKHRDDSRVWMALSSVVLFEGKETGPRSWEMPAVALNAAVDITFDDGEARFFVVESDPELLSSDLDSRELNHPLVAASMGKVVSDEITVEDRKGRITQLRHKYVARFHYILANYEKRFPAIFGFRSVKFDPEAPDGLDEIRSQLLTRDEWVRGQSRLYESANWPLVVLARNTGANVIETAAGVDSLGIKLKVALGNEIERKIAAQVVAEHKGAGCVLDLWTFWTSHRLEALDTIEALCGEISVAQHTLDELRIYRAKAAESLDAGLKTMSVRGGQIQLTEALPELVAEWVEGIDQAILWIEGRGANKAVVATDSLPDILLEHLQSDTSHLFDEAILALHSGLLLVSDDLLLRQMASSLGAKGAVWTHWLAGAALQRGLIDLGKYVQWSAALIEAGQSYLGISGLALVGALEKDVAEGRDKPGPEFLALSKVIGGENADPRSHIVAALGCIKPIWSNPKFDAIKQQATSHLLRQLLHGRPNDYKIMLRAVAANVRDDVYLMSYLLAWSKGHFVLDALI